MSSKNKNSYIYWGKVIGFTLLIIFFVRTFLFETHKMSSSQMESVLIKGDRVLVDKTAYGIRMPITILSIPFTFDKIGEKQAYSTLIQIPYKRLFESPVQRNDIVLFNNPADSLKPLDKKELLISRCVGLPGETIVVHKGILKINDKQYVVSPNATSEYYVKPEIIPYLKELGEEFKIDLTSIKHAKDSSFIELNSVNAYIINEHLSDSLALVQKLDSTLNYKITIPYKGKTVLIDESNINIYKQLVLEEKGSRAVLKDNKLYLDGKELKEYVFEGNYYWVISDNNLSSSDSRSLGFIPFKNIIGRASFILHNSENNNRNLSPI